MTSTTKGTPVFKRTLKWAVSAGVLVLTLSACGGSHTNSLTAADKAQRASNQLQGQVYQSKHNVEFDNYNLRQKVADDPSTILWCTFFPPGVQGVGNGSTAGQAFTVPVAGKLTSSNKRSYSDVRYVDAGNYAWYQQQVPGPDHMFGASSEYRYGFDPTLTTYYDFTGLASFCTTEPTVWQAKKTQIVVNTDKTLTALTHAAEAAIKAGQPEKALGLLKTAESK